MNLAITYKNYHLLSHRNDNHMDSILPIWVTKIRGMFIVSSQNTNHVVCMHSMHTRLRISGHRKKIHNMHGDFRYNSTVIVTVFS